MTSIEDTIFKSLLYDEEFVRRVVPYLDSDCFDDSYKTFFNVYKKLFDNYNKIPNLDAIAITLEKEPINEVEFENICEIITTISKTKDDLADTDWIVDQTEEYCKDKKIYKAIFKSIEIIQGDDDKLDKHAIPEILNEALSMGFDQSIGMEFNDDAERRYEGYTSEDTRIKFPLNALNILSNGGHKKKALSCILAGTNVGKSAMMTFLAGEFLKQGLNVLYISLEMDEESIFERVDANLMNVNTDGLKHLSKKEYLSKIAEVKKKTQGRFYAKQYPTSAAHAGHFRHLIKELAQKKKFKPDFVFIDYINICASSRYKSMNGVNSYSYIKAIAEEIRGLAVEFDLPIMTATQINRGGMNEQSPDMTSTSESFGLPATLDFFFAMTADEVLAENGQQMMHPLKTRWGNKQKVKPQMVNINWDKMRYSDVGEVSNLQSKVGNATRPDKAEKKEKRPFADEIEWE